jgi:hypothetical protein
MEPNKSFIESINWNMVAALATIVYTFGTFLLWWVTRRSLQAMRDAFKLNFLLALQMKRQTPNSRDIVDLQNWQYDREQLEALLRRAFPEISEDLIPRPSAQQEK